MMGPYTVMMISGLEVVKTPGNTGSAYLHMISTWFLSCLVWVIYRAPVIQVEGS